MKRNQQLIHSLLMATVRMDMVAPDGKLQVKSLATQLQNSFMTDLMLRTRPVQMKFTEQ